MKPYPLASSNHFTVPVAIETPPLVPLTNGQRRARTHSALAQIASQRLPANASPQRAPRGRSLRSTSRTDRRGSVFNDGAGPGRRTGTRLARDGHSRRIALWEDARLPAPTTGNDDGVVTEVLI